MTPLLIIFLIVIVAIVGAGACVLIVWNILRLGAYRRMAATDPAAAGTSKVPWILSVVACFVGPFVLLVAPAALVLGAVQLVRSSRRGFSEASRIPPG